jgi:hypothetical protein
MSPREKARTLSPAVLEELYQPRWRHNLKIPLFYGLLLTASYLAWTASSVLFQWVMYCCMVQTGYIGNTPNREHG